MIIAGAAAMSSWFVAMLGAVAVILLASLIVWTLRRPGRTNRVSPGGGDMMVNGAGWQPVGTSGRFQQVEFPSTEDAQRLSGGELRRLIYGEFDTQLEDEAWRTYVFDPLRVLVAEELLGAPGQGHGHIKIEIIKLTGPNEYGDGYREIVAARNSENYADPEVIEATEAIRGSWHVETSVVNHENPLNPRIGMTSILM